MSIKKVFFTILSVALFSTFSMAQGRPNQPNQPNQPREGFGRMEGREGGGGKRGFQMRRPGMMRSGGGMMNFKRLNLTDAQKQRIQSLMENNRRTMEAGRAQFEEIGKLMQLKRQGLLTTEQGTRLTSLQAQMKTNMEKAHNDILAVLTADQKTLLDQMKGERRGGRMKGMRDRMPMRRAPNAPNQQPGRPGGMMVQPPPPAAIN